MLSTQDVADTFNDYVVDKDSAIRFDFALLDDPSLKAGLANLYPKQHRSARCGQYSQTPDHDDVSDTCTSLRHR